MPPLFIVFSMLSRTYIMDYVFQEKADVYEKIKIQEKELKEALTSRKLAMDEYTEVSDK